MFIEKSNSRLEIDLRLVAWGSRPGGGFWCSVFLCVCVCVLGWVMKGCLSTSQEIATGWTLETATGWTLERDSYCLGTE